MSGESEKTLRDTFDEAKVKRVRTSVSSPADTPTQKIAPCILFLDEVDAITPKRENAQREMERRIVAQLLTCMDDLAASEEPVIIIGATNRPDSLDPALRRAGRFDHEIEMGVPSQEGREQQVFYLFVLFYLPHGLISTYTQDSQSTLLQAASLGRRRFPATRQGYSRLHRRRPDRAHHRSRCHCRQAHL